MKRFGNGHRVKGQKGFGMIELMVATAIATQLSVIYLKSKIIDYENDTAEMVGSEMLTIQDAASQYYRDNDEWPDQVNGCVGALALLLAEGRLVGFATSRWGTPFVTDCVGGPPPRLFRVSAQGINEQYARTAAANVISPELAGATLTSSIPIPGAGPVLNNYLSRVLIPGEPEANQMETNIDMNGNGLNNVASIQSDGVNPILIDNIDVDQAAVENLNVGTNLAWGDSELRDQGGQGDVLLGVNGAPGSGGAGIEFYFDGANPTSLEAINAGELGTDGNLTVAGQARAGTIRSDGTLQADGDTTLLSDLSVGGDTAMLGGLNVVQNVDFDADADINGALTVGGDVSGENAVFRQQMNLCTLGAGVCGMTVQDGLGGTVIAMGADNTLGPSTARIWAGGDRNNAIPLLNVIADSTTFSGNIIAGDIVEAVVDVRTSSGDSLARAVQDVALLDHGDIIDKPECTASAPFPRIYTALSHVASGSSAKLMYQAAAKAVDLGTQWQVLMDIRSADGLEPVAAGEEGFRRIMTVVKCEVSDA